MKGTDKYFRLFQKYFEKCNRRGLACEPDQASPFLTPTRPALFSQTVEILVFDLSAQSGIGRVLGALALRAIDSDGVFGSRNV